MLVIWYLKILTNYPRNADWQQGFLLEELSRRNIEIHFYINPGSALERYIRGYMAQEEMKKARERMILGTKHKAMSGKVAANGPDMDMLSQNKASMSSILKSIR